MESPQGYVVACDSTLVEGEVLFATDRNKEGRKWSNKLADAFRYRIYEVAQRRASQMSWGNPRVIPYLEAVPISARNRQLRSFSIPQSQASVEAVLSRYQDDFAGSEIRKVTQKDTYHTFL